MRASLLGICSLLAFSSGCGLEAGRPVVLEEFGYRPCQEPFECGPGRYCNPDGFCAADCRSSADCPLALGRTGAVCTSLGQCVFPGPVRACREHAACGFGGLCQGRCAVSRALCLEDGECPWPGEACAASCASPCGRDDDCPAGDELGCSPLGLCLPPGWERWVSPAELPPVGCLRDSTCQALGFGHACDCPQDEGGECLEGRAGLCRPEPAGLEPGDGPAEHPAHALEGTWGMRLNMAMITLGLPLVQRQTTNASNLLLVRVRHRAGDRLELVEKLCDLEMLNFSDTGAPVSNLIHVTIPRRFLDALPLTRREVRLGGGQAFRSAESLEVRGAGLSSPALDPLPGRAEFEADPADPRFLDQDRDGRVGMTTLTDGVIRGEIYIVQRVRIALDGALLGPDAAEGLVRLDTEEKIVSSSKPELVHDITTLVHPEPARTHFRLLRLADEASCADLAREARRTSSFLHHQERLPGG
jgi:hypothetical protein